MPKSSQTVYAAIRRIKKTLEESNHFLQARVRVGKDGTLLDLQDAWFHPKNLPTTNTDRDWFVNIEAVWKLWQDWGEIAALKTTPYLGDFPTEGLYHFCYTLDLLPEGQKLGPGPERDGNPLECIRDQQDEPGDAEGEAPAEETPVSPPPYIGGFNRRVDGYLQIVPQVFLYRDPTDEQAGYAMDYPATPLIGTSEGRYWEVWLGRQYYYVQKTDATFLPHLSPVCAICGEHASSVYWGFLCCDKSVCRDTLDQTHETMPKVVQTFPPGVVIEVPQEETPEQTALNWKQRSGSWVPSMRSDHLSSAPPASPPLSLPVGETLSERLTRLEHTWLDRKTVLERILSGSRVYNTPEKKAPLEGERDALSIGLYVLSLLQQTPSQTASALQVFQGQVQVTLIKNRSLEESASQLFLLLLQELSKAEQETKKPEGWTR